MSASYTLPILRSANLSLRRTMLVWAAVILLLIPAVAIASDQIVLKPVDDPRLAEILSRSFTLPMLMGIEGQTEADRAEIIKAEVSKLTGILQSLGYLDARVEATGLGTLKNPLLIQPVPGLPYRVGWIRVDGLPSNAPDRLAASLNILSSRIVGMNATQSVLREIADGVLFELREASFGTAIVTSSDIRTQPNTRTAGVVIGAVPGASLTFGQIRVSGSFRVEDDPILKLAPFQESELYRKTAIDDFRAALVRTEKFRRVRVDFEADPASVGRVDVVVELRDSLPDPQALAESSGVGPTRMLFTMLIIVLVECVRVTSLWSFAVVRVSLSLTAVAMVSISAYVVFDRLKEFLV